MYERYEAIALARMFGWDYDHGISMGGLTELLNLVHNMACLQATYDMMDTLEDQADRYSYWSDAASGFRSIRDQLGDSIKNATSI